MKKKITLTVWFQNGIVITESAKMKTATLNRVVDVFEKAAENIGKDFYFQFGHIHLNMTAVVAMKFE